MKTARFPGYRTMTAAQRSNAKAEEIFSFARSHFDAIIETMQPEADRLALALNRPGQVKISQGLGSWGVYLDDQALIHAKSRDETLTKLTAMADGATLAQAFNR